MWTHFMDMHSGGGMKLDWEHVFIEAHEAEAKSVFYSRFGRNPERVTCTCCGADYAIDSHGDLAQLTGYERGCVPIDTPRLPDGRYANDDPVIQYLELGEDPPVGYSVSKWRNRVDYQTVDEFRVRDDVKIIEASEIEPHERTAHVPEEGYVWQ